MPSEGSLLLALIRPGFARHLLPEGEGGGHAAAWSTAREGLLLRPWLLRPAAHSARALDRGERNGADARRAVAALRRKGIEAYRFDGADAEPGLEQALARPRRSSSPSRRARGRGGAGALRVRHRCRAGAAAHRLLFDHRGLRRPSGAWVDETSATRTRTARGLARLEDEARWTAAARARGAEADILRLAGIYGPGRNALVNLRRGEARRIVKPGQVFNRAHVDDIAEISSLVLTRGLKGQIWNVADDEPAPPQDVIAYAAALLGLEPPPEEPFDEAALSPMAREFYADNKRVSIAKAKAELGFAPAYPTYREGLKALAVAGEGRARP